MDETPLAYSVPDACKALSVGRTKLYALIAEGRIEALQLDGRTVIPAPSLRNFVASLPQAPIRSKPAPVFRDDRKPKGADRTHPGAQTATSRTPAQAAA
jgi:excisionase family DNA binding protein